MARLRFRHQVRCAANHHLEEYMTHSPRHLALALTATLSLLASACGSSGQAGAPRSSSGNATQPAQGGDSQALYQAAKKEGTMVVNTHDPENERVGAAAFSKRYPGVKIEWQIGRGADVAQKIITQAEGNVYNMDVMETGPHDMGTMWATMPQPTAAMTCTLSIDLLLWPSLALVYANRIPVAHSQWQR